MLYFVREQLRLELAKYLMLQTPQFHLTYVARSNGLLEKYYRGGISGDIPVMAGKSISHIHTLVLLP